MLKVEHFDIGKLITNIPYFLGQVKRNNNGKIRGKDNNGCT